MIDIVDSLRNKKRHGLSSIGSVENGNADKDLYSLRLLLLLVVAVLRRFLVSLSSSSFEALGDCGGDHLSNTPRM